MEHALFPSLSLLLPVLVGAVVLYIPFYLTFDTQASGILPLRGVSTRPFFFFLIWGLFLVISGYFLLRQLWSVPGLKDRNPGTLSAVLVIILLPFLLWAGIVLLVSPFDEGFIHGLGNVGARFGKLIPALAIVGVASYSLLLRVRDGGERAVAFSIVLSVLAFYLLVGGELFYLQDLFGSRYNTVFKIYYQAWLLLGIVSAYGLYYVCSRPMASLTGVAGAPAERLQTWVRMPLGVLGETARFGWIGLVVVLLLGSIYYPVGAVVDRTDGSASGSSLDGLAYLQRGNSGEYEAIRWLRDEAAWGRIVEAVGDSFSEFGRISSSTGLPTILGWKGHEYQWRGSTEPFRGREEQVARIYLSDDPEEMRRLLETYDIRTCTWGPESVRSTVQATSKSSRPFYNPFSRAKT